MAAADSITGMHDDPTTVPDSDTAYRRVRHSEAFIDWDWNLNRWIPLNAALHDPQGGREVSIYLRSFLAETEGPDDVASARPGSVAFAANVGGARSFGFGVTHRPDQDTGPLRHAHGNINGRSGWSKADYKALRNDLARQMTLAAGEITLKRPA